MHWTEAGDTRGAAMEATREELGRRGKSLGATLYDFGCCSFPSLDGSDAGFEAWKMWGGGDGEPEAGLVQIRRSQEALDEEARVREEEAREREEGGEDYSWADEINLDKYGPWGPYEYRIFTLGDDPPNCAHRRPPEEWRNRVPHRPDNGAETAWRQSNGYFPDGDS